MLHVVEAGEVVEGRLDFGFDEVILLLEWLRGVALVVRLVDALDANVGPPDLHLVFSIPKEPLLVSDPVSVQHILLPASKLLVRDQVEVPLGALLSVVVHVAGSVCIQLLEVFADVALQQQCRMQLLPLVLKEVMPHKLLLLEDDELLPLRLDLLLVAEA